MVEWTPLCLGAFLSHEITILAFTVKTKGKMVLVDTVGFAPADDVNICAPAYMRADFAPGSN